MKLSEKIKDLALKNKVDNLKIVLQQQISKLEGFNHLCNRGVRLFYKKQYRQAVDTFNAALKKNPKSAFVYYNLALTHQYLENYDEAYINYNKFLELSPEDYDGMYNLALIYYTQKVYDKAEELFKKCFEIRHDEESVKALTLTYLAQGKSEEVFALAQGVFETGESISVYYTIAKVLENENPIGSENNYLDEAIKMYKNILDRKAQDLDVYLSLSICCAKKSDWENALAYCKSALEYNPKSFEANNQMGVINYCCNNLKDSITCYETALNIMPEGDYRIYSNLAYAYEKDGQISNALSTFKKLIAKFPDCPAKKEIKNHMRIIRQTVE